MTVQVRHLRAVPTEDPHVEAASNAIERIHLHRATERLERAAMEAMFNARALGKDGAAPHYEDAVNSLIKARKGLQ